MGAATRVDALARERHHAEHLYPIWLALPKRLRGKFYVHPRLIEGASAAGVEAVSCVDMSDPGPVTLVAAYRDLKWARNRGRKVIVSEHGAGQSYVGVTSGSYLGALDRAGVVAVLVPGHDAARRHAATHPTVPAYVVGCPKLDRWHGAKPPRGEKKIAISFHWDCKVCPETQGAWNHYRQIIPHLAERFPMLGHAHPRLAGSRVRAFYERWGIEFVEDFDEVIERATVYVVDNSSTLYEWAALDRPCVVMNAPWYRRDVEHGLRFWSHADVGPIVNRPKDLIAAIPKALEDPPEIAKRRREIVRDVYGVPLGEASRAAATAVCEIARKWSG